MFALFCDAKSSGYVCAYAHLVLPVVVIVMLRKDVVLYCCGDMINHREAIATQEHQIKDLTWHSSMSDKNPASIPWSR